MYFKTELYLPKKIVFVPLNPMIFSSKILSQTITQLCKAKEITQVVISPGSRNAPLTIGFINDSNFKCYSVVDERCAGFFALGIAQQTGKPVALVCTSGSALLNYYPAIAEAFYSTIPLVVLSADRPENLLEIGDGQTINQKNVFANHIAYSVNCKEGETFQKENETEINNALNTALVQKLPVHINIPFSEPLYDTVEKASVFPENIPIKKNAEPFIDMDKCIKQWNSAKKKMVLVGVLPPHSIEQKWINYLSSDPSVLVLTETTSNLHHTNFIYSIDTLINGLTNEDFKNLQPDLLVTFGGMVVSKKIKTFLRNYSPKNHWHIDSQKAYDTYFVLNNHIKQNSNHFFTAFLPKTSGTQSNYQQTWLHNFNLKKQKQRQFETTVTYSDFYVFSKICKSLPKPIQLQIANSASIRYIQLFKLNPRVQVYCNRGTSGIDGSTSASIGGAVASDLPTIFITGDLSFFYDSNALWNNYIPKNFKIILINNSGGGIFRIIAKNKDSEQFSTFFETKHNLTGKYLCKMYGLKYKEINSKKDFEIKLQSFFNITNKPALLEIKTPAALNDKVLSDYFVAITTSI